MSTTLQRDIAADLLVHEEPQNAQVGPNPLRELARLSELRVTSDRASRAVVEGVNVLKAAACIFQSVEIENGDRLPVLHCRAGVSQDDVRPVATALAAMVARAANILTIKKVDELFENETWLQECEVNSYLGVPIFDSNGLVSIVAAVLGEENRLFSEEDKCWLAVAGQLVADSLSCEALARELYELKQQSDPNETTLSENASPFSLRQPSVLVIDDDRQVNDLLCEFLTMKGYQVEPAFNGLEALQAFHPAKHDLIITDDAMPLMNGWELMAALRARSPSLPMILISAHGIGEFNQSDPSEQGISAVLKKPVDLDELVAIVNSLTPVAV